MQLACDTEVAEICGMEAAVLVHNIYFWVKINAANRSQKHFHDGRYWTYQTYKGLSEYFDGVWSEQKVVRLANKARECGLIETAFFNENPRDRTLWYTVTEAVFSIYRNRKMDISILEPPFIESDKCIKGADSTTDSTTPIVPIVGASEAVTYAEGDEELRDRLRDFETMRKKKRKPMTPRAWALLLKKLDELSEGRRKDKLQMIDQSILKCWDTVYPLDGTPGDRAGGAAQQSKTMLIEEDWVTDGRYE